MEESFKHLGRTKNLAEVQDNHFGIPLDLLQEAENVEEVFYWRPREYSLRRPQVLEVEGNYRTAE